MTDKDSSNACMTVVCSTQWDAAALVAIANNGLTVYMQLPVTCSIRAKLSYCCKSLAWCLEVEHRDVSVNALRLVWLSLHACFRETKGRICFVLNDTTYCLRSSDTVIHLPSKHAAVQSLPIVIRRRPSFCSRTTDSLFAVRSGPFSKSSSSPYLGRRQIGLVLAYC